MRRLMELAEAPGVPGAEDEVRQIMRSEMDKLGFPVMYDRLGSIFAEKKGETEHPRILLAGHLDEVGFMVSEITRSGMLRFTPLGGWWSQVLLAQRVTVISGKKRFRGVIGCKPPHVLTPEERNRLVPIREMFIDVGAESDEQVKEWGIRVGDPVVPVCPFEIMPDGDTILAKALDNRVGCWLALEILSRLRMEKHPNTVIAGATVQEEVGLRGASTSSWVVEPEVAFALDVGVAEDHPGSEGTNKARLRQGPIITFLDATMIPHLKLRDFVVRVAEKHGIPYQIDIITGGGTDAGRFHLFKKGVPSLVIGVAARYIHSHVSMISRRDLENAARLLVETIKELDRDVLNQLTTW
ncbi:M42 family metallopeptidase [Staphylospora marina]|uniref:M42 family metallopeptidase n=1 Tax=Staphylospora marina TaxID=2490858 RepID=UPI000F5BC489|nr:M42 family metallopeptidase [Staphylospora marina]